MIYRPRSYAAYIPQHANHDVIADAQPHADCRCRATAGRPIGLQEACPRHAPVMYAMQDARHVLEGARS